MEHSLGFAVVGLERSIEASLPKCPCLGPSAYTLMYCSGGGGGGGRGAWGAQEILFIMNSLKKQKRHPVRKGFRSRNSMIFNDMYSSQCLIAGRT